MGHFTTWQFIKKKKKRHLPLKFCSLERIFKIRTKQNIFLRGIAPLCMCPVALRENDSQSASKVRLQEPNSLDHAETCSNNLRFIRDRSIVPNVPCTQRGRGKLSLCLQGHMCPKKNSRILVSLWLDIMLESFQSQFKSIPKSRVIPIGLSSIMI